MAAGYYISTKTTSAETLGSGALTIAPTSHYAAGGASIAEQLAAFVAATRTDCPFGGVTAATGKSLVTECTPDATGGSAGTCGATSVNAKAVGGTCVCKAGYYGSPLDASDALLAVATKGCTACPFGGTSADGATAVTDCTPAQTSNTGGCGAASVNAVAVGGTCHCKAGYYGTPNDASDATAAVATKGCAACPANSVSVAGTGTAIADCKVSAGYYLSAVKSGSATFGTITQSPANKHAAGGTAVSHTAVDTATACLFGGTSLAGSATIEDCVPDCGASTVNAVNARGTCICAANYYGSPLDASDATTAVATKGCTACPTNTEAVAGSSALSDCKVKAGYYMVKNVISSTTYTANAINIGSAHGLSNGDQVIYNDGGQTALAVGGVNVVDGTVYYVVDKAANTFKIATASGGTALVLTAGSTSGFFTTVLQVPANSYGAGGAAASETVTNTITATKTACPYGGTSAAASVALTACTPQCGTASSVKTTISLGTCVCASTHWGKPVDANGLTVGVAAAGCAPIAVSAAFLAAKVPVADPGILTVDAGHGYYTGLKLLYKKTTGTALTLDQSVGALANGAAVYVVKLSDTTFSLAKTHALAVASGAAAAALAITNDGDDSQTFTPDSSGACPSITQTAYTSTAAGAQTLADCEVAAGFYISTKTANADNVVGSMAASQITANHYAPANLQAGDVSGPVTTTSFACPFAGTTVRAGGKLSDCTPDCGSGTNAVANGGTCVCATTHYGTPVDANGATVLAATQGCSPVAQTVAIVQTAVTTGNAAASVIRIDGHGLYTGQKLLYTWGGTGTALTTSVGALADGTAQYVIKVDANTFQLATTKTLSNFGRNFTCNFQ